MRDTVIDEGGGKCVGSNEVSDEAEDAWSERINGTPNRNEKEVFWDNKTAQSRSKFGPVRFLEERIFGG